MFLPRGFAVSSVGLFLLAFVVTALGTRGHRLLYVLRFKKVRMAL